MSRDINTEAEKDPDKLEQELDSQRAHIDETLRALEQRFSPSQIMDQVWRYTRGNSGDFSRNLVNTIKENPVPTLLTATGLLWMMSSQHQSSGSDTGYVPANASYGVDPAYESDGESRTAAMKAKGQQLRGDASNAKDKAKDRLHQMGDSAHRAGSNGRERMHSAQDNMRNRTRQASEGFERMLQEQPLAVGAIGIALGALVGASLPRTEREDKLMGEQRDRLASQASDKAHQASQEAADVGRRVAEDAKTEVRSSTQSGQRPH